jgi:DNA recombination protein RmuC
VADEQAQTLRWVNSQLNEIMDRSQRMTQLAGRVEELGTILKVPKLRGLMGEQTLEAILRQVLPERLFATQHRFADGRIVDAVVHLGERIVPVDAKFPLEAFRRLVEAEDESTRSDSRRELLRAVRGRIAEISDRYIRPGEGTTDFALMFIPAEGVYAEVVAGGSEGVSSMLDEALARRVVPVSPATIFAFLSVVAAGMRGLEVERRSQDIVALIAAAEQEIGRLREEMAVLGRHLHNATQRHAEVETRLARVAQRLAEIGRWSEGETTEL